jgi:hypothetical protein
MAALARVGVGDTLGGELELGAGLPRELLGTRLVLATGRLRPSSRARAISCTSHWRAAATPACSRRC